MTSPAEETHKQRTFFEINSKICVNLFKLQIQKKSKLSRTLQEHEIKTESYVI